MYKGKGPTVCLTDEIVAEILDTVTHIVFKEKNSGEFRRTCLWKLHFYEN